MGVEEDKASRGFGLGVGERGLGVGLLALSLLKRGLIRARINGEQHLALADEVAVLEADPHQISRLPAGARPPRSTATNWPTKSSQSMTFKDRGVATVTMGVGVGGGPFLPAQPIIKAQKSATRMGASIGRIR